MPKTRNKQRSRRRVAGPGGRMTRAVDMGKQAVLQSTGGSLFLKRTVTAVANSQITAGTALLNSVLMQFGTGGSLPANLRTFILSFDYFRIAKMTARFVPRWSWGTTGSIPQLALVANYDDASAPASVDYVLGQSGCKYYTRWDREVKVSLSPAAIMQILGTSSVFYQGLLNPLRDAWFNTSIVNSTVFFPLVKYAVPACTTVPGTDGAFDILYDFVFELRQPLSG